MSTSQRLVWVLGAAVALVLPIGLFASGPERAFAPELSPSVRPSSRPGDTPFLPTESPTRSPAVVQSGRATALPARPLEASRRPGAVSPEHEDRPAATERRGREPGLLVEELEGFEVERLRLWMEGVRRAERDVLAATTAGRPAARREFNRGVEHRAEELTDLFGPTRARDLLLRAPLHRIDETTGRFVRVGLDGRPLPEAPEPED